MMQPYFAHLVRLLVRTPSRLDVATREIELSAAEAQMLRACDIPTARSGLFQVPRLPSELVRAHLLPANLAEEPTPRGLAVDETAAVQKRGIQADVCDWIRRSASIDERRVLRTMLRRTDRRIRKRELQQRLHRMRASDFNPALQSLIEAGVVVRDGEWLEVPAFRRSALVRGLRKGSRRAFKRREAKPTRSESLRRDE